MQTGLKTILVCDDEPIILEAVNYIIGKEGYNVLNAENGEESLKMARENIPDLMLLDGNMPDKTGFEVCEILKNDSATKGICIVMFTANVQASDYEKADQVGADGFIQKPFSPKELRLQLHKYLD
jgi:two-component system, OmpR family, alkaline phosphatase synthesis response regulator PhoP